MINRLDNKDEEIVKQILELQKASYRIEADLIGFDKLPPLLESMDDIRNSEEIFFGYFLDDRLSGLISYRISSDMLDIHRLAVHPDCFKRGIAKKLLEYVEATQGVQNIIVCTGLKNTPAVRLYSKLGFIETETREVAEGIYIICFEKKM